MFVKCPQPALGPREERQGGHHGQGNSVVQQRQPGADESHVVIERQPADTDVAGAHFHCLANRADVREQIRVGKDHAFRVAGRPGSVLQQSDVRGSTHATAAQMRG